MAVEEELNSGGGDHRWTTATTLQTRFNPCVIERLLRRRRPKKADLENSPSSEVHHPHHHHHFIIGTYELVEEGSELSNQYSAAELAARNRRLGTLELLKIKGENGKIVLSYESPYGGVFDLRVLDDHDATHHHLQIEEEEDPNFVVTAHANGVVALYLIYCGNSARIEPLKSWSTFAKMLTTVEIIKGGKAAFCFYAGAESGELLRVNWSSAGDEKEEEKDDEEEDEEKEVTSLGKLTDYGHPIWYLRAVEISVSTGETHLLFIGSEDSKWRVVVNDDSTNEPGFVLSEFFLIILLILSLLFQKHNKAAVRQRRRRGGRHGLWVPSSLFFFFFFFFFTLITFFIWNFRRAQGSRRFLWWAPEAVPNEVQQQQQQHF